MSNARIVAALLVVTWATIASAASLGEEPATRRTPKLVTLPETIPAPEDNPTTPEKSALGKQLFFDPRLSGDNTMSCATCHLPDKVWGDAIPKAKGAGGKDLTRNTPTLLNVAFYQTLLWDGRSVSLEEQALVPVESPDEMHQDADELVEELAAVPGYSKQFEKVFGRPVNRDDIARALAAFERTLVTRNSPFDRYLAGDKNALSPPARQGLELFQGDAGCIRCHHGPLLSDGKYYRIGIGAGDKGRGAVTGERDDLYRFRTPSLRDVGQTGPYMHDGSQATLYDVVQFYYRGVPTRGPEGLDLDVQPLLGQSFSEIESVVEFLKSLSGEATELKPPELP